MRRRTFFRWLFYGAATLLFLFLQQILLNHLSFWNVHPFLLPSLAAIAAAYESRQEGIIYAAVLGLFTDLAMPGIIPIFYVLAFSLCAFLSGVVARRLIIPGFVCSLTCACGATALCDLLYALIFSYSHSLLPFSAVLLAGRELLLTVLFILPVHFLFRSIHLKFRRD